ncbi:MAG: FtsX-like permease family protein [Actinobacteria bacterium]|nr:FtsX-like permease family protein [Actinomycetota bacterium]
MRPLGRKLLRDISSEKGRFLAVILLIFLGLTSFSALWISSRSLETSYRQNDRLLKYEDFSIQVGGAPESLTAELSAIPGVGAVLARYTVETGCSPAPGTSISAQLIGEPAEGQAPVDDLMVLEGSYLPTGGLPACMVEQHLAKFYDLKPGDTVTVETPQGPTALEVSGVVASPEFYMVSGTGVNFLASPRNYGIVFVSQNWVTSAFHQVGNSNQFIFLMADPGQTDSAQAAANGILAPYNIEFSRLGSEQPVRKLLESDIQNFRKMSMIFPLFFLIIAALSIFMIITRLVHNQRRQMGTMMALGFSRRRIARHYLSYPVVVGLLGSVAGIAAGYGLALLIAGVYTSTMGIPRVFISVDLWGAALAVALAVVACMAAAAIPIWRMVRMRPASVMRDQASSRAVGRSRHQHGEPAERHHLKVTFTMPLRNLSRDWRRALFNLLGVVFAIMLIVVSLSMLDWLGQILDFQYHQLIHYDADVLFTGLQGESSVAALGALPGVDRVEPYVMVPCRFQVAGQDAGEGTIKAVQPDTQMMGFYDEQGHPVEVPSEGILLNTWFHDGLGVKVGDPVEVVTPMGSLQVAARGFVKQFGGLSAYVDLNTLQGLAGSATFTGAMVVSGSAQGEALRGLLLQVPSVSSVAIPGFVEEMIRSQLLGPLYAFVGFLIAFAVAMALALIYNTMSISFLEREREVTLMLALGYKVREVAAIFAAENMAVALGALIPGLVGGAVLFNILIKSMTNEVTSFPGTTSLRTFLIAALAVMVVVFLSQLPSLLRVRRIDLSQAIKSRSL